MTLLGVSYTRKTTRDLDRTYGIMQVLGSNFRVGLGREAADPRREYTLAELKDEFGAALIEYFPILTKCICTFLLQSLEKNGVRAGLQSCS